MQVSLQDTIQAQLDCMNRLQKVMEELFDLQRTQQGEWAGFVYFIESQSGLWKIGKAIDVEKRKRDLQVASPVKLEVRHTIATDRAYKLENMLHRTFAKSPPHRRVHGEWFEFYREDALA